MSSGLTYDNSGILVGTSGTTRALTVSSTGTVGIGYLNNTTVPSSAFALDVYGVMNTNQGINLSYITAPTFTSNQIGYQFIVYENKTVASKSYNNMLNLLTHATPTSTDLTTSGNYITFPPGIWIVNMGISFQGNNGGGIGSMMIGLTTDYNKNFVVSNTNSSNGFLGTPFGTGASSYSQNDYFFNGGTFNLINAGNYGYSSGTVVVNCTTAKNFLWVAQCIFQSGTSTFQVAATAGQQGVLVATRIA
uniref:Uncharacterized protein n=1 Tax=viral metagenome TaxID=1070528 RepID=A0A6C0D531_9ZZZZ